jgi:hypothetical protein
MDLGNWVNLMGPFMIQTPMGKGIVQWVLIV